MNEEAWSPEMVLFDAIRRIASKLKWHGWVHSTSAGLAHRPMKHDTRTIALSAVVETKKTTLEICFKCRYYAPWGKKDMGPADSSGHWYELFIKDKYCVFGKKMLVEISSCSEDHTYAIHKNTFETVQSLAIFCEDQNKPSKVSLCKIVSNLLTAFENR